MVFKVKCRTEQQCSLRAMPLTEAPKMSFESRRTHLWMASMGLRAWEQHYRAD